MDIPDAKIINEFREKIRTLEVESDQWCRDNEYAPIMDIDVTKQRLLEENINQTAQLREKETLKLRQVDEINQKYKEALKSTHSLTEGIELLKHKAELLTANLKDLNTVESDINNLLLASSITEENVIKKYVRQTEAFNL